MAKGQKRGNREIRKPKVKKPAVAAAPQGFLAKAMQAPVTSGKKKG